MKLRTALTLAAMALIAAPGLAQEEKTVANLKAAYLGETTAHAKYAAYARAADREGYREAAQLFRAASAAEATHARNHKSALADLGVDNPTAGRYTTKPGATRENLQDAYKGECYERDVMYPAMIRDAKAEVRPDAERSMIYALAAEKQHAALYRQALMQLGSKQPAKGFYVCPVCGATYAPKNVPEAAICGTPKEQFKQVR